jgi:hypothetical protein
LGCDDGIPAYHARSGKSERSVCATVADRGFSEADASTRCAVSEAVRGTAAACLGGGFASAGGGSRAPSFACDGVQFGEAGLIRRISVPGRRGYFDVDTGDHYHFYIAEEDRIIDIPTGNVALGDLPEPPAGYRLDKVDIVVHLRRADSNPGKPQR